MMQVQEIPLGQIKPSPKQARTRFEVTWLKASIERVGVLQPLRVRKNGKGYELEAGERRYRALKELKAKTAPCVVVDEDDGRGLERSAAENLQRADLGPLEESGLFNDMLQAGMGVEDVAEAVGRTAVYVRGRLALATLHEPARKAMEDGKIGLGHALVLVHAGTEELQKDWLKKMLSWGFHGDVMSAHEARRHFLAGWLHDGFAWPASFVEPCPSCRMPQPSLFEDEDDEKQKAQCFDDAHREHEQARYIDRIKNWAGERGIEWDVPKPENRPWHLSDRKKYRGLEPRMPKATAKIIAWYDYGNRLDGWIALTAEDIKALKARPASSSRGVTGGRPKPTVPELRKRAAEKAARRHLSEVARTRLEIAPTPLLLEAFTILMNADMADNRRDILKRAGLEHVPTYQGDRIWAALRAGGSQAQERVVSAAIEHQLAKQSIPLQAEVIHMLGVDPLGSYRAAEEDLKALPREALISALPDDHRGQLAKAKKGDLVQGKLGADLETGLPAWTELREMLQAKVADPTPEELAEEREDEGLEDDQVDEDLDQDGAGAEEE